MPNKVRYSLILIGTIISLWMGIEMWNMPLWSYRPLFFFASLALVLILLFRNLIKGPPMKDRLLALSGISAVLLYMGFPTMPLTPLMFIAFVPILMIEDDLFNWRVETSLWPLFRYTFIAFLFWNILSTFWVANTSFVPSIAAFTLNSVFMSVPILLYHLVRKKLGDRYRFIALICFWISFEYGHMAWEISWPWLTLGNAFAQYTSWIQWYEFTGHLGGSLWILGGNILAYKAMTSFKERGEGFRKLVIQGVSLIIVPILLSVLMYFNYTEKGFEYEVAVLQGNYEPHYQKFNSQDFPKEKQLEHFLELANQVVTDSTEYLVLPETSFWTFDIKNLHVYPAMIAWKRFLLDYPDLKLVTGLVSTQILDPAEKLPRWARESKRQDGTVFWELQNSAVQIKSNDSDHQVHIKSKLVPGPEIFPYNHILFFLKPIIEGAGGTLSGHAMRKERTVFKDGDKGVAPVICYESIYGEYVGEYVRKGAQAIFVVTNDGWWDNTPGHIQHLMFSQLRAIEHRRPVARSANTGISCFIDQKGRISQPTQYETPAAISQKIRFNSQPTFYSRWGDLIARMAILGTIILILSMIVKKFRNN